MAEVFLRWQGYAIHADGVEPAAAEALRAAIVAQAPEVEVRVQHRPEAPPEALLRQDTHAA